MLNLKAKAQELIFEFKGDDYIFGLRCLNKVGKIAHILSGENILLITNLHQRAKNKFDRIVTLLKSSGLKIVGHTQSARPNSPKEDVFHMAEAILASRPDSILVASGGSGIDAAKAAIVLADLGGDLENYFGVGKVTEKISKTKKKPDSLFGPADSIGFIGTLDQVLQHYRFSNFSKKTYYRSGHCP